MIFFNFDAASHLLLTARALLTSAHFNKVANDDAVHPMKFGARAENAKQPGENTHT